ncbi:MAG: ribokinase, partial [Maritimibacter sp.]
MSRVGKDPFGDMALAAYRDAGVTPRVLQMDDASTGAAFIFVNEDNGDNAIIVVPGAAGLIGIEDVEANRADIERAAVFMTQLEQPIEAAMHGLSMARAAGVTTIFNPAPAQPIPEEIYALCDYFVPNEVEAADIVGHPVESDDQARAAADQLLARGAKAVILTLGSRGALYHTAERIEFVPAFSAGQVIDTTGAGDAFLGGF